MTEVMLTTLDGRRLWRRFDGRGRCVAAQDMPKQLTPEEVEQVFLHGFPVNETLNQVLARWLPKVLKLLDDGVLERATLYDDLLEALRNNYPDRPDHCEIAMMLFLDVRKALHERTLVHGS